MVDVGQMASQGAGQYTAREVSVLLQGNTGQYQAQMGEAAEATLGVVDALEKVEKTFKAVFGTIGRLMTGAGATMTAFAGVSMWSAAQFEDSFARVEKTTGLAGNALRGLGEEIRKISTEIPVAVDELAYLADIAGQMDVAAEDVALFAEVGAKLGAATDIGSAQAVASLAKLRTSFNLASQDVEGLGSAFADLVNHTAATEFTILGFSERVAGTAATVGMAAEEVLGWGAAITASGTQTELGATAFSQTMLTIQRAVATGSEELGRFAAVLGMTRGELQRLWADDPTEVMIRFVAALSEAGDEAAVILDRLKMSGVGMSTTFLNLASAGGEAEKIIRSASKSFAEGSKALDELAEVRFGTLIQQLRVFRQSISEVWRSLGLVLLPAITKVVEVLTGLVNIFNSAPQWVKSGLGAFLALGGGLLTLLGTATLLLTAYHGIIFTVGTLIPLMVKLGGVMKKFAAGAVNPLTAQLTLLKTQMAAVTAGTTTMGAAMTKTAGGAGILTKAITGLTLGMTKLTFGIWKWGMKEFGQAAQVAARGGVKALGLAAGVALIPLAKMAAVIATLYGLFKAGQWVWGQLQSDALGAADTMQTLADSMDMAYTPLTGVEGAMRDGAASAKEFAEANAELIQTLNQMSDMEAEDFLKLMAMNFILSGTDPEEVQETIDRLSESIRGFDGTVKIDFSVDESGLRQAEGLLDEFMSNLLDDSSWVSVSDDAITGLNKVMENIKGWAEQGPGGFAASLSLAFDARQGIEDAFEDGQISRMVRNHYIAEWEDGMDAAFPAMEEATGGSIRRLLKFQGGVSSEEFASAMFGDLGTVHEELLDPIMESLAELGHDLDNFGEVDMDQFIVDLSKVGGELMNISDAVNTLDQEMTVIEKLWEEGEHLEGSAQRRFQEAALDAHVAVVGQRQALRDLNEELQRLISQGQGWEDGADRIRKKIEDIGREYAAMRLAPIESMIQAGEAERAMARLNSEIRQLNMALPGAQAQLDAIMSAASGWQSMAAGALQNVLGQRDSMLAQIDDIRDRTSQRTEDMQAQHNERMADMETQHSEALESIHKGRNEQLKKASEAHGKRMKDIAEREKEALKNLARQTAEAYNPMERIQSRPTASTEGVIANIERQSEVLEKFRTQLAELQRLGVSGDVISALKLDDPANFAQVDRLLGDLLADPSLIDSINAAWGDRLDIGTAFSGEQGTEIREQFDKMRKDAAEAYADQTAEINAQHAKAVQQQGENFAKQQKKAREDFRKSVDSVNEDATKQIDHITAEMEKLGARSGDSLEELIQKGYDSNIEGIQEMARQLEEEMDKTNRAIDDLMNDQNDLIDSWARKWGITYTFTIGPDVPGSEHPFVTQPGSPPINQATPAPNPMPATNPQSSGQPSSSGQPTLQPMDEPEPLTIGDPNWGGFVFQPPQAAPPEGEKTPHEVEYRGGFPTAQTREYDSSTSTTNDFSRLIGVMEANCRCDSSGMEIRQVNITAHDYNDFRHQMQRRARLNRLAGGK